MRFTTKTEYGLVCLIFMARKPEGALVTVGELASQEGYSVTYVEKILQSLRAASIVVSHKGKEGGYSLARGPHEISLKEVIEALEGLQMPNSLAHPQGAKWLRAEDHSGMIDCYISRVEDSKFVVKQRIPKEEINPEQSYLSNRIRPQGVMEKCTFCLHRTREGRMPACLEACPTGARVFGNLLDPESDIRKVLNEKRVFVLKEELGTRPSFFYFFDE